MCLWETEVTLLELFFPDGDYHFKAQFGKQACRRLCTAHLRKRNNKEAWYWLEKERTLQFISIRMILLLGIPHPFFADIPMEDGLWNLQEIMHK